MKTMVIMMGIQGSGKSTFYHSQLADEFVHINLDSLKTRYQERSEIEQCIQNGQNYVFNNQPAAEMDIKKAPPFGGAFCSFVRRFRMPR